MSNGTTNHSYESIQWRRARIRVRIRNISTCNNKKLQPQCSSKACQMTLDLHQGIAPPENVLNGISRPHRHSLSLKLTDKASHVLFSVWRFACHGSPLGASDLSTTSSFYWPFSEQIFNEHLQELIPLFSTWSGWHSLPQTNGGKTNCAKFNKPWKDCLSLRHSVYPLLLSTMVLHLLFLEITQRRSWWRLSFYDHNEY